MAGLVYDDLIMDHIRNARHYCVPEGADASATESNVLCGDEITIYLKRRAGRIADIGYQAVSCGIAMASGSIMTEMVNGMRLAEAEALAHEMLSALNAGDPDMGAENSPERLALIDTLRRFPARVSCAALPWLTLERVLASCVEETAT